MLVVCGAMAQSRVNFSNGTMQESLIYTNSGVARGPIAGPPGSWRFELFWAADGVTDSFQLAPSGVTNANSYLLGPGRIYNRFVAVDWGQPGMFVQIQVRGWSANLGDTWSEAVTRNYVGRDGGVGWMGQSAIVRSQLANGLFPGAPLFYDGGALLPQGATQISFLELVTLSSFTAIPEPATCSTGLITAALGLLLMRRRA